MPDEPNRAILLHPHDNVATALANLQAGESLSVSLDGVHAHVTLRQDIAFGHKFALCDIPEGAEVLKYGMPIGKALEHVVAGDWVHVHNCRSHRWGFHNDQYGVQA